MGTMMNLSPSDIYTYTRPSICELRVYLRHRGEPEGDPSPYQTVIRRLGQRHEQEHLRTFAEVVNISDGAHPDRIARTAEAVRNGAAVIYQPALIANLTIAGQEWDIRGDPDFLIRDGESYALRDCKIARRITEKAHPEILRQLELYGWLYEQTFGAPPSRLEVFNGMSEIVDLAYNGGTAALELLEQFAGLKTAELEPYSPVGWTKCDGCPFHHRCWPEAETRHDVALVRNVDQNLARSLRENGIETWEQLVDEFEADSLAEYTRPWGKGTQRVGKKAPSILLAAQCMIAGEEALLQAPAIPDHPNYVMFDLEGLPPQLDELEKVYLWGFQVYGADPGEFFGVTAGFGDDGDRQGWQDFLAGANAVFERHGDLPFVHWAVYEKTKIRTYIDRHGDVDGIAARVAGNLLDMLPITQKSIALPLPSYSLKVVEQYVGFQRQLEEYGGEWAMAKYIEAVETEDPAAQAEVMDQILAYNEEDLQATWAVLEWLRAKST